MIYKIDNNANDSVWVLQLGTLTVTPNSSAFRVKRDLFQHKLTEFSDFEEEKKNDDWKRVQITLKMLALELI